MDPIVKKYAAVPVPRYTSYPTVPHFSKGFPPTTYRGWLEALDTDAPISLYVHVPFCKELCWYCGCNMKLVRQYNPVSEYVETLLKEMALVRAALPGRLKVSHIHFGGGTPTALEPDDLGRVRAALDEKFDILGDAECAIEGDPRTMTAALAKRIGDLGFTRASFGIQEFDPKVQKAINRLQPAEMVRRSVEDLRDAGVEAINFDLIYGLPHQSVASLLTTIDLCAAMKPDRFALFGYAHVPWMAKKQRLIPEDALPDTSARHAQAQAAAARLTDAGYVPVGLDHFARAADPLAIAAQEGTLRRNFQGYTTDTAGTLLGFGVTSIGYTPHGYVQALSETRAWGRAVDEGVLPVGKGHSLTGEDRLRAHVIERLMCEGTVDTIAAGRAFGQPAWWCADALAELQPMIEDGLLTYQSGQLTLCEHGQTLVRVVAAAFDSYRKASTARHSVAV